MADDRNESGDVGFAGSDGREPDGFLPPLTLEIDAPDLRYTKLSRVVADHVVPRLLTLHELAQSAAAIPISRDSDVVELAQLVLGPENEDAANFVRALKDGGVSLDDLHAELLEPTARHIGELWNEDTVDFVDVTLAVGRLQRLVHVFEGLDQIPDYDSKRKVLLACAPGEQHSLGTTIVQKFLRAAGWHVWSCGSRQIEEAAEIAAQEWFAVVGFSLASDVHVTQVAAAIAAVRSRSANPRVGIMVGGAAIARKPELVNDLGADGTAANGPAAVILAKKLLAEGLG